MSLARFGCDGSDVYVYEDVSGGYTCCGCPLFEEFPRFFNCDAGEMVRHLNAHIGAGHKVPGHAFDELGARIKAGNGGAR